jgi:hypothetical protein
MQLKINREHFITLDNGFTWVPKIGFGSLQEIKNNGFNLNKWHPYTCTICNKLHVAKIKKGKSENDY